MSKSYYVYILASKMRGTLYVGVTNSLKKRVFEHKTKAKEGFTTQHKVDQLVYYEQSNDIQSALNREKHIKNWNRIWKIELIEEFNPEWNDLYNEI
ncbi:GIY-YIG nuclease family protein [candidate division KSB1 bacterium]